jgi:putative PIN family toxin of toxin-antitoxin system
MLRVVLDTNIIVSSLISKSGPPAQIIDAWRQLKFILITSPAILEEIRAILKHPRICKKYKIADEDIDTLINLLNQFAFIVPGEANVAGAVPADPADEKFLACALDGQATSCSTNLLVSGDHHLLDLKFYQYFPLVTARQFLELMFSEGSV